MTLEPILQKKYESEGIDPSTNAFALIDGKVYTTVAGMEIKAMRSGVLAGKASVVFGPEIDAVNPHDQTNINVPTFAVATYKRFCMDKICEFQSDPVQFFEYAKKRWHYEKPFMFLAKIARACALRHAFPDIFAGVISYEEQQCELGFDKDTSPPKISSTVNSNPKTSIRDESLPSSKLPPSPKAVSDIVAAIFKQGVQS